MTAMSFLPFVLPGIGLYTLVVVHRNYGLMNAHSMTGQSGCLVTLGIGLLIVGPFVGCILTGDHIAIFVLIVALFALGVGAMGVAFLGNSRNDLAHPTMLLCGLGLGFVFLCFVLICQSAATCPDCQGTGRYQEWRAWERIEPGDARECPTCQGSGKGWLRDYPNLDRF